MTKYDDLYKNIYSTMGELQPIAFLLSATIVLAGFYAKNNNSEVSQIDTLLASTCFFFAYIEFASFKLTKFNWFLIVGMTSLSLGFVFIFQAIIGLMGAIYDLREIVAPHDANIVISMILYIILTLFILTLNKFALHMMNKTGLKNEDVNLKIFTKSLFFIIAAVIIVPVIATITKTSFSQMVKPIAITIFLSFILSLIIIAMSIFNYFTTPDNDIKK